MSMAGDMIGVLADVEATCPACVDTASVGDEEDWPASKRHCPEGPSRMGIGFAGIALTRKGDMPEKVQHKPCAFCEKVCSAQDDLVETNTMAWFKPHWQGKARPSLRPPPRSPGHVGVMQGTLRSWLCEQITQVCAYCGWTKMRLHPSEPMNDVAALFKTSPDMNGRFRDFRAYLLEQHARGARAASGYPEAKQMVQTSSSFAVVKRDPGKMILYHAYVAEHGDRLRPGMRAYRACTAVPMRTVAVRRAASTCPWALRRG